MTNGTKTFFRNVKRGLFARAKIRINGAAGEIVTTKNYMDYFIMYKIHKASREKKLMSFMETMYEQFPTSSDADIKAHLSSLILRLVKCCKESDLASFFSEYCMEKGRMSAEKIARIFRQTFEADIDLASYVRVGVALGGDFIKFVRAFAGQLCQTYGKQQKQYLSAEEIHDAFRARIPDDRDSWWVSAFVEYAEL